MLDVSFKVIVAVIKSTNREMLNINFELFFLKTPKTNKNIIDSEIKISGNTKLRFSILFNYKFGVIRIY